jgi:hypothetical protein
VAEAQSDCAELGKQYAPYLPSDVTDQMLLWTAYQVKAKP